MFDTTQNVQYFAHVLSSSMQFAKRISRYQLRLKMREDFKLSLTNTQSNIYVANRFVKTHGLIWPFVA